MNEIHITTDGLLAGERYLRDHPYYFDDGTSDGFHADFVKALVSQVLDASCIKIEVSDGSSCQQHGTHE